jgi:hypothetical protein
MITSYSRRRGDYMYDIQIRDASTPEVSGSFCAHVMNMMRFESGRTVFVDAALRDEYAATLHEALSKVEAALEAWVRDQTRSRSGALKRSCRSPKGGTEGNILNVGKDPTIWISSYSWICIGSLS